jgi:glycosyltransferase involved in cell wall biosynthesis
VTFSHIGTGDATYQQELERAVQEAGLERQVTFGGEEPSSDRLLGSIDALVVASDREPFSVAVLEALAAGVPVIAADSGGARDIIKEGVNGRLYRPGDAAALAGCLAEWVRQPPAWPEEQIRATTVPISQIAGQWADVYAALG